MFFLDSIALLVLLSVSHTSAQSFNNESSTQTTLSPSSNATVSPSPSRTLNITSSQDYIQSCNAAWQSYKSNSKRASTVETVATITGPPITSTSYLGVQKCTSYCGDICYADTKNITGTALVTQTYPNIIYQEVTRLTYSEPAPNCTIPAADCKQLWSAYTTDQSSYDNGIGITPGGWLPPSPVTPGCSIGCQRTLCSFGGGDKGIAPTPGVNERYWNSLQVYYFPETRNVSRDMCARTPTQAPIPFPTEDVTTYIPTTTDGFVVVDGKTFYRGNVYISISQMEVFDNCDYTTVMEDVAFPVASSDVISERADVDLSSKNFPVNWADFNEPIPYSAYVGGLSRTFEAIDPAYWSDHDNYCKTAICDRTAVIPESFHPWILLPPAVKHVNPAFSDCAIRYDLSFFDPPIALHGVPNFLTTASSDPVATPAEPASSVIALPVQTSAPGVNPADESRPSDPSQPGSSDPSTEDPSSPGSTSPNDPPSNDPPSNDPPSNDPTPGDSTPTNPQTPGDSPAPGNGASNRPSNPRPTGNYDPPSNPSHPQITVGPTIIPIAPNGQGLVIHSPTTIAPAASAVISGTTIHLESGVLTMVSPSGTSSLTVGDAGNNAVGTVVNLGGGGAAFTITTASGSVVFDVATTIGNGDPAQTVDGMVVSVGSDGVHVSNTADGSVTTIAFTDVAGLTTDAEGRFKIAGLTTDAEGRLKVAGFTGAVENVASSADAPSSQRTGGSDADAEGSSTARSGEKKSSSVATSASGSKTGGSTTSSSGVGSGTDAPSSPTNSVKDGGAIKTHIPWFIGLVSVFIAAL